MNPQNLSPRELAIGNTIAEWAGTLKYFPQDANGKAAAMRFLDRIAGPGDEAIGQLHWLCYAAIDRIGEWDIRRMRELFCSRFRPADGVEPDPREPILNEAERKSLRALVGSGQRLMLPAPATEGPSDARDLAEKVRELAERRKLRCTPNRSDYAAAARFLQRAGLM